MYGNRCNYSGPQRQVDTDNVKLSGGARFMFPDVDQILSARTCRSSARYANPANLTGNAQFFPHTWRRNRSSRAPSRRHRIHRNCPSTRTLTNGRYSSYNTNQATRVPPCRRTVPDIHGRSSPGHPLVLPECGCRNHGSRHSLQSYCQIWLVKLKTASCPYIRLPFGDSIKTPATQEPRRSSKSNPPERADTVVE